MSPQIRAAFLLLFTIPAFAGMNDLIHDDYSEAEPLTFHSRGLLTYGSHSNTFHLRHFFARANYERDKVQAFLTLNGYKDTHDPATAYGYIINNINLYDYGIDYRFYEGFHLSLRGAATYRENYDSHLLILPYYFGSPAEFDTLPGYLTAQQTGPGVRLGYRGEKFEVGYSQGDFRHVIPTAFLAKYSFIDDMYLRAVVFSQYQDPLNFPSPKLWHYQLSTAGQKQFIPQLGIAWLAEATRIDPGQWRFRFEQAILHFEMILAFRQIFSTGNSMLFETSLKRRVADLAYVGLHYASRGNFYIGTEVNF